LLLEFCVCNLVCIWRWNKDKRYCDKFVGRMQLVLEHDSLEERTRNGGKVVESSNLYCSIVSRI